MTITPQDLAKALYEAMKDHVCRRCGKVFVEAPDLDDIAARAIAIIERGGGIVPRETNTSTGA